MQKKKKKKKKVKNVCLGFMAYFYTNEEFYYQQFSFFFFFFTQLNVKTVLFQTIQFSISTPFSFIWPIDRSTPHSPKAPVLLETHQIV